MAFLVVNHMPGGDQRIYEKVRGIVEQKVGQMPPGSISHVAGKTDTGWMVVDVWESESAWKNFIEETLKPAFEEAGESARWSRIERRTADVAVLVPA
jgi:heme-degrading monooxygenase HmoA